MNVNNRGNILNLQIIVISLTSNDKMFAIDVLLLIILFTIMGREDAKRHIGSISCQVAFEDRNCMKIILIALL